MRRTFILFAIVVSLSCATAVAEKAELDPNSLFTMSLEELMDVTVVSGSRIEQELSHSSVPISVITAEDIHYSGLTNIADMLRFSTGMDVFPINRNYYATGIHGLHDQISERTLNLINGRIADSPFFGGSEFYRYPILMEDIDRIEIIRGPGGAAWGANAYQGVINIITKKPEDLKGYLVSSTVNEYGDNFSQMRLADTFDDWAWKVSVGYENADDSDSAGAGKMDFFRPAIKPYMGDTDAYRSRDFSRKLIIDTEGDYNPSDSTRLSFGLGYSHNEIGDYEFLGYYAMGSGWLETVRAFTKAEHTFEDGSTGHLQWTGNFYNSYRPSVGKWKSMENDFEAQYNFEPWDQHNASVGGNFRWTHISPDPQAPENMQFEHNHYNEYLAGLFLIDRWTLSEKWALEGQLRGDWYSESQKELSTRLTALYTVDPEKEQVVRFSMAKAFRSPLIALREGESIGAKIESTVLEMLFPGQDFYVSNVIKPSEELKNEHIWAFEMGYQQKIDERTRLNIDGYYHRLKNLLGYTHVPEPAPVTGYRRFYQATNGTNGIAYGVDVELKHNFKNQSVSAWYSFNDLRTRRNEEEGDIRAYAPAKHKTGLTWRIFMDNGWVVNTNYRYQTFTPEKATRVNSKTYHRLDIALSHRFAKDNGEFMIGVADVINETEGPNYSLGHFSAYETPGRTFFTRLQFNF